MSLKHLLGLDNTNISEFEIARRLEEAQNKNIEDIEFLCEDGSIVRVHLPHLSFDPFVFKECS